MVHGRGKPAGIAVDIIKGDSGWIAINAGAEGSYIALKWIRKGDAWNVIGHRWNFASL